MSYALFAVALLEVLSALSAILKVGKPRETITPATAAVSVVFAIAMGVVLVMSGLRLM